MTDQLDTFFQELACDVVDDGFSEGVIKRIEGPRLVRWGLSACIYLLTVVLILGPLREVLVLASNSLSVKLSGLSEVGSIIQNPTLLVAFLCVASIPAAVLALKN